MIVHPLMQYKETYTITLYTDTFQINVHSYIIITKYENDDDKRLSAFGDRVDLNLQNITEF